MSAAAIGLFYGAGLTWGQHTHLSIVEYWRWWVVHLWVEGFFEVFATTVIAFFLGRAILLFSLSERSSRTAFCMSDKDLKNALRSGCGAPCGKRLRARIHNLLEFPFGEQVEQRSNCEKILFFKHGA
jgi:hypothetical protein